MEEIATKQIAEIKKRFPCCEELRFRGEDIPTLVEEFSARGISAIGITGNDLFQEYLSKNPSNLAVLKTIPWFDESFVFKKPCLCLLAPKEKELPKTGKVCVAINKKFERLSENFLEKLGRNGLQVETKTFNGNTELAVKQGLADFCVEIVCTGASLEEFNLKVIDRFFESDLVLIGSEPQKKNWQRLSALVKERLDSNSKDSYTASVVKNGLVLEKLNEECFELIQAAIEGRKSKIVWETADLVYFLTILLAEKGIQLQEVWNELGRRELEKQQQK